MPDKPDLEAIPADVEQLPLPPGGFGLPIIGQSIELLRNNRAFFVSRFQKYGPVFKTSFAGNKVVCFVGHRALTFFYRPELFGRADANGPPIKGLFNYVAIPLIDGDPHRVRKSLYLSTLDTEAFAEFLPLLQNIIMRYLQRWELTRNLVWRYEAEYLALGISNAMMLGDDTGSSDAAQKQVVDTYTAGMASLPIPLPFTKYGRAVRARDKILEWVGDAMVAHRRRMQPGGQPINDLLTRLLRANEEAGKPLSDDVLRTDGLHVYFSIYTAWSLQFVYLVMSLGLNRHVMARTRAEVMETSPSGPVTMEQLQAMTYLQRVTLEARRLNPILPVTFQALVLETCAFNGYRIPKGWTAIGGLYATMQDPAIFVAPETFEPDRFAPETPMPVPKNGYVPHGGGEHIWHRCLGEDSSNLYLQLITVLLLRTYDWDIPDQDLEPAPGNLFSTPKSGLQVVFRRR